jgi:hypothetical protein
MLPELTEKEKKKLVRLQKKWNFIPFVFTPYHDSVTMIQLIMTPWFIVSIHRISKPDPAQFYHGHPWNFTSIMLWGAYDEQIWDDPTDFDSMYIKRRRWLSAHRIKWTQAHRIHRIRPSTTTLFIAGRWKGRGLTFYRQGELVDVSGAVQSLGDYNVQNMRE